MNTAYNNSNDLAAYVFEMCDLGRYFLVQTFLDTQNYPFVIYNSCGEEVADGKHVYDDPLEKTLEDSLELEIDPRIYVLDVIIINFTDGKVRYIVEINDDGDEHNYLLEADGTILCKLPF